MSAITFQKWIETYANENSPIGDLARDISMDKCFPIENTYAALQKHIGNGPAAPVFEDAWAMYTQNL